MNSFAQESGYPKNDKLRVFEDDDFVLSYDIMSGDELSERLLHEKGDANKFYFVGTIKRKLKTDNSDSPGGKPSVEINVQCNEVRSLYVRNHGIGWISFDPLFFIVNIGSYAGEKDIRKSPYTCELNVKMWK